MGVGSDRDIDGSKAHGGINAEVTHLDQKLTEDGSLEMRRVCNQGGVPGCP